MRVLVHARNVRLCVLPYGRNSKHTTVVAYDRAGLGVSAEGPTPRTAERQSEELHHLIRAVQTRIDGRREGGMVSLTVVRLTAYLMSSIP